MHGASRLLKLLVAWTTLAQAGSYRIASFQRVTFRLQGAQVSRMS
jgi:hypothetical protein